MAWTPFWFLLLLLCVLVVFHHFFYTFNLSLTYVILISSPGFCPFFHPFFLLLFFVLLWIDFSICCVCCPLVPVYAFTPVGSFCDFSFLCYFRVFSSMGSFYIISWLSGGAWAVVSLLSVVVSYLGFVASMSGAWCSLCIFFIAGMWRSFLVFLILIFSVACVLFLLMLLLVDLDLL